MIYNDLKSITTNYNQLHLINRWLTMIYKQLQDDY